jgi:hypothetical protein
MMKRKTTPSFLRLFMGGFALGAMGMLGVQSAHADSAVPDPFVSHFVAR